MIEKKVIRKAKIAKEVPHVHCGNQLFTDKSKEYSEELWREGDFDDLIKRGFLEEIKPKKSEPVVTEK